MRYSGVRINNQTVASRWRNNIKSIEERLSLQERVPFMTESAVGLLRYRLDELLANPPKAILLSKEKELKRQSKYNSTHKEERKAYYHEHKEELNEYAKVYYLEHKEEFNKKRREKYALKKEFEGKNSLK